MSMSTPMDSMSSRWELERERERVSKGEKCLEAEKMKENETETSKVFFFFFNGKSWIEFGYIVFGLNGAQWDFS